VRASPGSSAATAASRTSRGTRPSAAVSSSTARSSPRSTGSRRGRSTAAPQPPRPRWLRSPQSATRRVRPGARSGTQVAPGDRSRTCNRGAAFDDVVPHTHGCAMSSASAKSARFSCSGTPRRRADTADTRWASEGHARVARRARAEGGGGGVGDVAGFDRGRRDVRVLRERDERAVHGC